MPHLITFSSLVCLLGRQNQLAIASSLHRPVQTRRRLPSLPICSRPLHPLLIPQSPASRDPQETPIRLNHHRSTPPPEKPDPLWEPAARGTAGNSPKQQETAVSLASPAPCPYIYPHPLSPSPAPFPQQSKQLVAAISSFPPHSRQEQSLPKRGFFSTKGKERS